MRSVRLVRARACVSGEMCGFLTDSSALRFAPPAWLCVVRSEGNVTTQIEYSRISSRWKFPSLFYTFNKTFQGPSRKVTVEYVMIDTVCF